MSERTAQSILVGLIGSGISSSLSPALHEREGRLQGMSYIYRLIDLDELGLGVLDLPDLVLAGERMGFTGLNITHPCKQSVVALLDEFSQAAEDFGSVNTVVFRDGKRIGHNTDAWGFAKSFEEDIAGRCRYERPLLIGVGGAGRAVAHTMLANYPCRLDIFDVDGKRAAKIARQLCERYGEGRANAVVSVEEAIGHCDGIINATPVGMESHPGCPLDPDLLHPGLWVADIVYFPLETALVKAATERGCVVMKGGGMAVYQAARAFERFTGRTPDVMRMKAHFEYLIGLNKGQSSAHARAALLN